MELNLGLPFEEDDTERLAAPAMPTCAAVGVDDGVLPPVVTDSDQPLLFAMPPSWSEHWDGMPHFQQRDLMPWQTVKVHLRNADDRQAFADLVGQRIGERTISVWFPKAEAGTTAPKAGVDRGANQPKYPIYVISKGRWETRLTVLALEALSVDFRVVIEPQEYEHYAAVIAPDKLLVLPFSNLGQGSIPARNWVWEHAVQSGAARHWILDDNIRSFMRLHDNMKSRVCDGYTFAECERFVDRYRNVAMAGMNYQWFAKQKQRIPPYNINTRIYSCILLDNALPHRWRGRYNEDTDLSIRLLKDGFCTVLFNAFLADKQTTMTMAGGNTDELYRDDGRLRMAESLRDQHPDIVRVSEKWGRPQHHVDYSVFRKNKLIPVDATVAAIAAEDLDDGEELRAEA